MPGGGRAVPEAAWQAAADASEVLGPESGLFADLDPADFGLSTLAVLARAASRPQQVGGAWLRFGAAIAEAWPAAVSRWLGFHAEPGARADRADRRFADPAWSQNPAFNVLHAVLGADVGSDDLFVLLIGLAEVAIGAALISGRLTRLVVLGMWLPFHLGIPLLPDQELIGHLPIFGIMYVLLVHGSQASVAAAPRSLPARQATVVIPTARRAIPTAGRPPHRLLRRTPVGYTTSRPAARRATLTAFGASRGPSTTHTAAASKTS